MAVTLPRMLKEKELQVEWKEFKVGKGWGSSDFGVLWRRLKPK